MKRAVGAKGPQQRSASFGLCDDLAPRPGQVLESQPGVIVVATLPRGARRRSASDGEDPYCRDERYQLRQPSFLRPDIMSPAHQEHQASILDAIPFAATCGIELVGADPERVRATLQWAPERCTTGGLLHGGVLMTLADTAGAVCAFLNLPDGATTATIESKSNFFRAVRSGTAHADAHPLHIGRTTIVVQTDLSDDKGKLVAQVTQTQAVLRAGPDSE